MITERGLKELLEEISYPCHDFVTGSMGDGFFLQVEFPAVCAKTHVVQLQKGRKWYLSPHMTASEVMQTALLAAIQAAEHEVREKFRFQGKAVFNPHYDVFKLASADIGEDTRAGQAESLSDKVSS